MERVIISCYLNDRTFKVTVQGKVYKLKDNEEEISCMNQEIAMVKFNEKINELEQLKKEK